MADTFGRWTIIEIRGEKYLCRCVCGTERIVNYRNLKRGGSTSCGCSRFGKNATHGQSGTALHNIWLLMKDRCNNPKRSTYDRYGGRGITVCERWQNSFECFAQDMGERPSLSHTIERINNDGNYEPSNCRWATKKEQAQNTYRTLRYDGRTLKEIAEESGINYQTLRRRFKEGQNGELLLRVAETPLTRIRTSGGKFI